MGDDKTSSPYLELFLFQSAFSISSSLPSEGKLLLSLSISFPFNSLSSLFLYFPSSVFLPLAHLLILLSVLIFLFPSFTIALFLPVIFERDRRLEDRSWSILLLFYFPIPLSSLFWENFSRLLPSYPFLLFTTGQRPFFSYRTILITSHSVRHPCSPF